MRESIYLFKEGFKPIWEDRRNLNGGSWTFRIPKNHGRVVWEQVQMLAIGEGFEAALEEGTLQNIIRIRIGGMASCQRHLLPSLRNVED